MGQTTDGVPQFIIDAPDEGDGTTRDTRHDIGHTLQEKKQGGFHGAHPENGQNKEPWSKGTKRTVSNA